MKEVATESIDDLKNYTLFACMLHFTLLTGVLSGQLDPRATTVGQLRLPRITVSVGFDDAVVEEFLNSSRMGFDSDRERDCWMGLDLVFRLMNSGRMFR